MSAAARAAPLTFGVAITEAEREPIHRLNFATFVVEIRQHPPPAAAELEALAAKYAELAEMRRREAEGAPPREDAHYREIARRFPGAPKELDQLELAELDRRRDALREAVTTGSIEPWMRIVHAYHGFMRAALAVRRASRGEEPRDVAHEAQDAAGFVVTEIWIAALVSRGACRVVPIDMETVFAHLAERGAA